MQLGLKKPVRCNNLEIILELFPAFRSNLFCFEANTK